MKSRNSQIIPVLIGLGDGLRWSLAFFQICKMSGYAISSFRTPQWKFAKIHCSLEIKFFPSS